jgi:hypothetical protein
LAGKIAARVRRSRKKVTRRRALRTREPRPFSNFLYVAPQQSGGLRYVLARRLTTHKSACGYSKGGIEVGAGEGNRTLDTQLGKLMFYH